MHRRPKPTFTRPIVALVAIMLALGFAIPVLGSDTAETLAAFDLATGATGRMDRGSGESGSGSSDHDSGGPGSGDDDRDEDEDSGDDAGENETADDEDSGDDEDRGSGRHDHHDDAGDDEDDDKEDDDEDEGRDDDEDDKKDRGHGTDKRRRDIERADKEHRNVGVSLSPDRVEIDLKRETAENQDRVRMDFDFEEATFGVRYEQEEGRNETEQKLRALFLLLGEYRDADGDGAFTPGEPVLSAWGLGKDADEAEIPLTGKALWLGATVDETASGGVPGTLIRAPARLGDNGTFTLVMHVYGHNLTIGDATLKPTSTKIDILIERFPYAENDTALFLLLETETKSETKTTHEDFESDEEGVAANRAIGDRNVTVAFTWKDHAEVDGNTTPVKTTLLGFRFADERDEDGAEFKEKRRFALSYARGESIVHDPEAYVAITPAGAFVEVIDFLGDWRVIGLGMAAAAAVVVATILPRRRYPGE